MYTVICIPKDNNPQNHMEQTFYFCDMKDIARITEQYGDVYYIGYKRGDGWKWTNKPARR